MMSTPGLTSPRSDFVVSGTKTEKEPRNLIQFLIHPKDTRFPQSVVPFSFFMFLLYQENEVYGGRKVWGVGVMKDKELMVDEIESSHILGGSGEGHVQVRGKWERYSSYSITLYCRRIHNIYMVVKTLFDCASWTPEAAKKRSVSRWVCKNKRCTNSLCNLPDVLEISIIKEIVLGGLLL